jgi:hypothetical protein
LISFLNKSDIDIDSPTLIHFKRFLLERTNYHLIEKISAAQNEAMLIAAFLDPKTFSILNDKELKDAKKWIFDKSKNFAPEITQANAKKIKTSKKSNLNSPCAVSI